jgi:bifunctional UDP-N-acetylglucosamine pyrophosphorylase/glucosamine-1-phosphate N-acetyltransferase
MNAKLEERATVGNFVEVKKSHIGRGTKAMHLSYLGDATIGNETNIGAGTVTCNYDGVRKHETVIEDNVKIGSDTMLVAPVRVGARSVTGAGSVVTKDVPPDSLAVGVPAVLKKSKKRSEGS